MADKPPTLKYHYWQIGVGILILGCVGFQIVRPTNKTTISDGGSQINYYDVPKLPLLSGGCMRLKSDIYWQKDPSPGIIGQKQEVKK